MRLVSFKFPEELVGKLDAVAKETGLKKTFFVRQSLSLYLEDLKDYFMALERLKGWPEDFVNSEEAEKILREKNG